MDTVFFSNALLPVSCRPSDGRDFRGVICCRGDDAEIEGLISFSRKILSSTRKRSSGPQEAQAVHAGPSLCGRRQREVSDEP